MEINRIMELQINRGDDQMRSLFKLGVILIGVIIFGSVGCSSRKYWTKENLDPEQYRKDEFYCKEKARSSAYRSEGINMTEIYKECMYSLGYIFVEEKEERGRPN